MSQGHPKQPNLKFTVSTCPAECACLVRITGRTKIGLRKLVGIINEIDLDKALRENLIFGAGLDVFETEPPKSDNPLLKNDKVFLSPHTAAFTEECMIRMGKETIQNIIDFFEKKLDKSKIIKL